MDLTRRGPGGRSRPPRSPPLERERDGAAANVAIGECSQRGSDGREVATREPAAESRLDCDLAVRGAERPRFECPGEPIAHVRGQREERLDHGQRREERGVRDGECRDDERPVEVVVAHLARGLGDQCAAVAGGAMQPAALHRARPASAARRRDRSSRGRPTRSATREVDGDVAGLSRRARRAFPRRRGSRCTAAARSRLPSPVGVDPLPDRARRIAAAHRDATGSAGARGCAAARTGRPGTAARSCARCAHRVIARRRAAAGGP